jgi:hypothetical protein
VRHPASGSGNTDPTAMESNTIPSSSSESACRAFTAGMCGTQLARTRPLTKKMVETAHRARMGSRVGSRVGGDALLGDSMTPV